jgi:hypothetical protein
MSATPRRSPDRGVRHRRGAGFNLNREHAAGDPLRASRGRGIDPSRSVNRSGRSARERAGAACERDVQLANGDVDAGASPAAFIGRAWNGAGLWRAHDGHARPTSTQVTGLSAATPGTVFALGNPVLRALSVATSGTGTSRARPTCRPDIRTARACSSRGARGRLGRFSAWSGALTGNTNPANLVMDADKA